MKSLILVFFYILLLSCNPTEQKVVGNVVGNADAIASISKEDAIDKTAFIHTVFFWMQEGVTDSEKKDFNTKGLGSLMEVPSIYKGYHGPPAMTPRDVVDNSYDFALVCQFKNSADHDLYQEDKIHLKFIEDYKHLWKDVVVYDNLVTQ